MVDKHGTVIDMKRTVIHKDPTPGYYEGRDDYAGKIYEVRRTKDGLRWYALHIHRVGKQMRYKYVGHSVRLGEEIVL